MISTETVKASSEVFYKYNLWFNDRHAILIGPEIFQKIMKPMADRCLGGKKTRLQIWITLPKNDRKLLDIEYAPHYEKGQKKKTISGYVESTRDITDIKKSFKRPKGQPI